MNSTTSNSPSQPPRGPLAPYQIIIIALSALFMAVATFLCVKWYKETQVLRKRRERGDVPGEINLVDMRRRRG